MARSRSSQPRTLAADLIIAAAGALWFTEPYANRIGRVTTEGELIELQLPTADAMPTNLAVGADGAIWFVETAASQIGRLVPVD